MMKRKTVFLWLKVLIIIYCVIGLALYYLQDKFLFHPEPLAADHPFSFEQKFEELHIAVNEEDTISLVKFLPGVPSRGAVIYLHGNMANVERYAKFVSPFLQRGYEVWMPDYPGFGKSTRKISEKKLYEQALQVRKMAAAKFADSAVILYGKSLGSGIAANLATQMPARMLILETPYYSVRALFNRYAFMYPLSAILHYEFPTYKFLSEVKLPVYIFHGTDDAVIPYSHALRLKKFSGEGRFFTIKGAGHNGVNTDPGYLKTLDSLIR